MSHIREYVGCKSIEAVNYDGDGNTLYNMWVTDEEIVRCRDCKHASPHPTLAGMLDCLRFVAWSYVVEPDGFCKWGERR